MFDELSAPLNGFSRAVSNLVTEFGLSVISGGFCMRGQAEADGGKSLMLAEGVSRARRNSVLFMGPFVSSARCGAAFSQNIEVTGENEGECRVGVRPTIN